MSSTITHTTEMRKGQESKVLVEDIMNEKRLNRIPRYAESSGTWSPAKPKNPTKKDFLLLMKAINNRAPESPQKRVLRKSFRKSSSSRYNDDSPHFRNSQMKRSNDLAHIESSPVNLF